MSLYKVLSESEAVRLDEQCSIFIAKSLYLFNEIVSPKLTLSEI